MDITTPNTSQSPVNSNEADFPLEMKVIFFSFNALLLLFGCGGNGIVIIIIMKYKKLRDTTVTFLMHLAITDFITAFVSSFYALSFDADFRNKSFLSCIIQEQTVTYMIFVSQFVLAVVSFDRYIAVCHNVRYPKIMTKIIVNMLMSIAWIVPLIFTIIPVFEWNNWNIVQTCNYHNLFHDWVYDMYSTFMIILMIFPLVFYVKVLLKARQFYKKFSPAQIQGINANSLRVLRKKQSIKNGKIMGVVTMVFILCWFPLPIYQFQFGVDFKISTYENGVAMLIIMNLGMMNSIINPLIYAWQKKDFQTEARRLLKCTICRREGRCNQEELNIPSTSLLENGSNKITPLGTRPNATITTLFSSQNETESSISQKHGDSRQHFHVHSEVRSTSPVKDSPRHKTLQVQPYIVSTCNASL